MEPRPLQYIAQASGGELRHGSPDRMVTRLCSDSRQAGPNDLFFALSGSGSTPTACPRWPAARVAAIVAERAKLPADFHDCPVIAVDNTRRALGRLAARDRARFPTPPSSPWAAPMEKPTTKELIASVLRQKEIHALVGGQFQQ